MDAAAELGRNSVSKHQILVEKRIFTKYSPESCMEIGPSKYRGEIFLLLLQTKLFFFLRVLAFVGVMVE